MYIKPTKSKYIRDKYINLHWFENVWFYLNIGLSKPNIKHLIESFINELPINRSTTPYICYLVSKLIEPLIHIMLACGVIYNVSLFCSE